jgi:hypothetical protein
MRYTGPSKPVRLHHEIISDRAEAVIFVLFAIFMVVFLCWEG